jgi:hypothetical protein
MPNWPCCPICKELIRVTKVTLGNRGGNLSPHVTRNDQELKIRPLFGRSGNRGKNKKTAFPTLFSHAERVSAHLSVPCGRKPAFFLKPDANLPLLPESKQVNYCRVTKVTLGNRGESCWLSEKETTAKEATMPMRRDQESQPIRHNAEKRKRTLTRTICLSTCMTLARCIVASATEDITKHWEHRISFALAKRHAALNSVRCRAADCF